MQLSKEAPVPGTSFLIGPWRYIRSTWTAASLLPFGETVYLRETAILCWTAAYSGSPYALF